MSNEKETRKIIPEPLDSYRETIAMGMTMKQIVLVGLGMILLSISFFLWNAGLWFLSFGVIIMVLLGSLGVIEVDHKTLIFHLSERVIFLFRPKVYVYHHFDVFRDDSEIHESQGSRPKKNYHWIFWGIGIGLTGVTALFFVGYILIISIAG